MDTRETPEARVVLEGQLRECYGRVVYTHKTHEKCADILLARLAWVKFLQIVLSAVTTVGFIGVIFGSGVIGAVVGTIVSMALLALNTYTKDYDLGEIAQKHKQAGADIWSIREKYLSLLTDLKIGRASIESIQEKRDCFLGELHAVYSGVPSTTFAAYKDAQKALQRHEDMTFSDAEIDAFLPHELKRG